MTEQSVPPAGRICTGCGEWKSLDNFQKHPNGMWGRKPHCRACSTRDTRVSRAKKPEVYRAAQKRYYHNNKDKERKRSREASRRPAQRVREKNVLFQRAYSLELEDARDLLSRQGNKCPICGDYIILCARKGETAACLDHDHKTGVVRGLLCSKCNTGIGMLGDSIEGLRKALEYLEKSYAATSGRHRQPEP